MYSVCSIKSSFISEKQNLEYYTWISSFPFIYLSHYFFHFFVSTFLKLILHLPGCHISRFNPLLPVFNMVFIYMMWGFNFHFHFFLSSASLLFHFPLLSFHLFHEPLYLSIILTSCREHFFIMSLEFLEKILVNISVCSLAKLFCFMFICILFSYSFSPSPFLKNLH